MKKILIIISIVVMAMFNVTVSAQERNHSGIPSFEEFLAERVRFIVSEMKLDSQDSAKFVVVYNQMMKDKGELMKKYRGGREIFRKMHKGEPISDDLYMNFVTNQVQLEVEDAKLEQEYIGKFSQVLTPKQIFDYRMAERRFKDNVIQRSRKGKN